MLFLRSDELLKRIHQSRVDNSTEKVLRSLLAPDLLIIDDFGFRRLSAQQSSDFYEVIIERHRRASTIVTSNRAIEELIPFFDDPILAQSALDRLAHNAYQIVMEGESYRSRQEARDGLTTFTQERKEVAKNSLRTNTNPGPRGGWVMLVRMGGSCWWEVTPGQEPPLNDRRCLTYLRFWMVVSEVVDSFLIRFDRVWMIFARRSVTICRCKDIS